MPLRSTLRKAVLISRLCMISVRLVPYFPTYIPVMCCQNLVWMISPKAGMVEVVREAVLMGEHRLMSLPFICPGLTRLGIFRPPRLLDYLIQGANYHLHTDLATQAFFCECRPFPLGSCSSASSAALCSPPHHYCPLQRSPTTSSPAAICSPSCFNAPSWALAHHAPHGWASHQD